MAFSLETEDAAARAIILKADYDEDTTANSANC